MTDDPRTPGLTVALPTCNGARHLPEALRSILAQGDDFDLVLVDDRSDDDTVAVARSVAGDRLRISVNDERLGLAGNWNACVRAATTPLVAVFHQDDVMRPGHLASHREAFADDPDLVLVASSSGVIDSEGHLVPPTRSSSRADSAGRIAPFEPGEVAVVAMSVVNPLRCSAVSMRADAHERLGGFDPTFSYVVDWDFWLRMADVGNVRWLSQPTMDVRWHVQSETHQFKTGTSDLEETSRLLDRIHSERVMKNSSWLRRKADRRLGRAYLNRSHEALRGGDAELASRALRAAIRLDPALIASIAIDPRLAAQMAALAVAPAWAARTFKRSP